MTSSLFISAILRPSNGVVGHIWFLVVIATALIEFAGTSRSRTEATARDQGSLTFLRLTILPGIVLVVLAPSIVPAANLHPPETYSVIGLVIFTSGEALRVWAKRSLGRYFTYTVMTSSDQPVITSGPYRLLCHPSYTGILLIAIGVGLGRANLVGLAAMTISTLVGLIYRIRVEERALLADLGQPYRDYADRHKRLIPLIW